MTYGHKPGVVPGDEFKGRGWLMATGVHMHYYFGEWKASAAEQGFPRTPFHLTFEGKRRGCPTCL